MGGADGESHELKFGFEIVVIDMLAFQCEIS
jgi:hypothetical protein